MTSLELARVAVAMTMTESMAATNSATAVLMDFNSQIIRNSRAEEEEESLVAMSQAKEKTTMQGGSCREVSGAMRACELALATPNKRNATCCGGQCRLLSIVL